MDSHRIPLRFLDGVRWAVVREPTGADELAVDGVNTFAAVRLIERLLIDQGEGSLTSGAERLAAADRDQAMAAVNSLCFDDRIASTLTCPACARPFDFSFSLSELAAHVAAQAGAPDKGLRLPTGADEIAVAGLPPAQAEAALASRCLGETATAQDIEDLGERLARAAPLVSMDLDAACPECGAVSQTPFDVQAYVLGRIRAGRASLVREAHGLASAYGWSAEAIFNLPRSLRHAFAATIDAERGPRRSPARLRA